MSHDVFAYGVYRNVRRPYYYDRDIIIYVANPQYRPNENISKSLRDLDRNTFEAFGPWAITYDSGLSYVFD